MHRALAFGTLVGFLLSAFVALGQEPAPPAPPAPPPAPSATPPAPPPAETAAPPAPPPPAESAAPPAAVPVSAVSVGATSTSATSPTAPKPEDHGPEPKRDTKKSDPWQDAHALGVEGNIYASGRLGPSSIAPVDEQQRFGVGFDLSAWYTLSTEFVLGFGLTHADLGNVSAGSDSTNEIDVDYGVTAAYLGARAFPVRKESWEIFVGLRVGLAWQDLDARGVRTLEPNVSPPAPFTCSGVSGPGFALGAGIGGALRLGSQAWLTGHFDANGYKLTSDVVENCTVGIGSVTNVTLGAGFLYAFDLGSGAKLDARAPRAQTW